MEKHVNNMTSIRTLMTKREAIINSHTFYIDFFKSTLYRRGRETHILFMNFSKLHSISMRFVLVRNRAARIVGNLCVNYSSKLPQPHSKRLKCNTHLSHITLLWRFIILDALFGENKRRIRCRARFAQYHNIEQDAQPFESIYIYK